MDQVFDPSRLSAVSLDVLTAGHATPGAIAARQKARLARVLEAALHGSCFYRGHLAGADADTPLAALAPVTRGELMAHFEDWVTDPRLKLADLQGFAADPARVGEPYLGRYVVWESSGTSGQPGMFVQDAQAMAAYDALETLRRSAPRSILRWLDPLYLTERIAFVGATGGHFASHVSIERLRGLNPWMRQNIRSFSILERADVLVEALNTFSPSVITTYPSVASLLAEEAGRGTLRFRPREVWTGGETLDRAVRHRVEKALACAVRDSYGASEFLNIGWECAQGRMHVNADWVILEPVDDRGKPVPEGHASCSVLLTHLANRVQPLIRYDLGDQITLRAGRCACGSPLPVIEVQGRRGDPLVMAGENGRPVTLLPMALTTVLEEEADVFDFQLCRKDAHTLVLRLALDGDEGASAMARCRAALTAFTARQGIKPVLLIEELGQSMPRGRSGKACRVRAQCGG